MLNKQIYNKRPGGSTQQRNLPSLLVMGLFVLLTFGFFFLQTDIASAANSGERPGDTTQSLEQRRLAGFGGSDSDKYNGSGKFLPLKVGFVPLQGFLTPGSNDPSLFDGYAYALIQTMAAFNGWDVTYVPGTWEENIARLRSGEIDFFPEAPGRCVDSPDIAGTDYGIATVMGKLVLSSEAVEEETSRRIDAMHEVPDSTNSLSWSEKRREYTTLDEMREAASVLSGRQYALGYVANIYPGRRVPDAALSGGIKWTLMEFPDPESMERAFHGGRIDAYLDNSVRTNKTRGQNAYHFDSYECRLLVRRDRQNLLDILNAAIIRLNAVNYTIKEDNGKIFYEGPESFVRPAYTASELKYLREHPVLRATAMADQAPLSFMEGGVHKGILADLLKLIAEDMGVSIELVPSLGPDDTVANISSGKADFLADLNANITWARRLKLNLTAPYMNIHYAQIGRRGSAVPVNPIIAAPRYHFFSQNYVEPLHRNGHIVYFDNVESTIDAVAKGHADIAYIKNITAFRTLAQDNHHNLYIRQMNVFSYPLSFGVWENEDPMLFRVLNKAISRLQPGIAEQISGQYLTPDLETTTGYRETLADRKGLVAFVILVLVVTGITAVYAYRYHQEREFLRLDPLTGHHNRRWLEEVMPGKYQDKMDEPFQDNQLFVLTIGMARIRSILEMTDSRTIAGKLKELLEAIINENEWAVLGATSSTVGQIFVVCRFEDKEMIVSEITEIIRHHDSMEIAHGVIHPELKAGVAPVDNALGFREAVSEAIIKALDAYNTIFSGNEVVSFYDSNYNRQMNLQTQIEAVMEKALEKKEFLVYYQPKYELKTKRIIGAESLVRWQSADLGFMNPGSFIELFEKNGFVVWLDHYMLDTVMAYQRRRINLGLPLVPISVNQSRHHLTEPGYLDRMEQMAKKYQLPAGAIELELTETVFGAFDQLKYQENALNTFKKLREMGFVFSIDDFGSGYSSFRLLSMLPFDAIKIDRSLLLAAEKNSQMRIVIAGIVDLGEKLEMTVICEGIETVAQEQLLMELGCKYGQGYLNGRPMPENEFHDLMSRVNRNGEGRDSQERQNGQESQG